MNILSGVLQVMVPALAVVWLSACSFLTWDEPGPREEVRTAAERPIDVAAYLSTPEVQIFGLDDTAAPRLDVRPSEGGDELPLSMRSPSPMPAPLGPGRASSQDSSVTLYPLDSSGVPAGTAPLGPPGGYRSAFPVPDRYATSWQNPPGTEVSDIRVNPTYSPFRDRAERGGGLTRPVTGQSAQTRIYFDHDSEQLDPRDRQALLQLAETVKDNPALITIVGHASPRAAARNETVRDIINLRVSLDRAFEVAQFLIRQGVPAEMIHTAGLGDKSPGVVEPGVSGEQASRRVEIYLGGL